MMRILNTIGDIAGPACIRPRGFVLQGGKYNSEDIFESQLALKRLAAREIIVYVDYEGLLVKVRQAAGLASHCSHSWMMGQQTICSSPMTG